MRPADGTAWVDSPRGEWRMTRNGYYDGVCGIAALHSGSIPGRTPM